MNAFCFLLTVVTPSAKQARDDTFALDTLDA